MDMLSVRDGVVLQSSVILLQILGVVGLILSRAVPGSRLGTQARWVLVLAVIGLGIAGVLHGHDRSGMNLIAGGTMTFLLVGMITGTNPTTPPRTSRKTDAVEPTLIAP